MKWGQESVANEVFEGMLEAQNKMVVAEENKEEFKTIKALEELNLAAELYAQAGDYFRSNQVTKIMIKVAEALEEAQTVIPDSLRKTMPDFLADEETNSSLGTPGPISEIDSYIDPSVYMQFGDLDKKKLEKILKKDKELREMGLEEIATKLKDGISLSLDPEGDIDNNLDSLSDLMLQTIVVNQRIDLVKEDKSFHNQLIEDVSAIVNNNLNFVEKEKGIIKIIDHLDSFLGESEEFINYCRDNNKAVDKKNIAEMFRMYGFKLSPKEISRLQSSYNKTKSDKNNVFSDEERLVSHGD